MRSHAASSLLLPDSQMCCCYSNHWRFLPLVTNHLCLFVNLLPNISQTLVACLCLPVQVSQHVSPVMSPQCGETHQQTAAGGLSSNWFLCSNETLLLYTASDNYNEARCWENIMGGGLSVSCDEPIVCVMRPGNYQPRNARLEIRLIIHH